MMVCLGGCTVLVHIKSEDVREDLKTESVQNKKQFLRRANRLISLIQHGSY
jgi:hypothetical protein